MTPDQLLRREYLAHLLGVAQICESYARTAAHKYEQIAIDKSYPALFKGLAKRLDEELTAKKVRRA